MRTLLVGAILMLATVDVFSQREPARQMFRADIVAGRGNHHQTYEVKDWRFFAGAPVRSTVLVWNEHLFFGTAAGDFFAMTKAGQVKWKFHSPFPIHSSAAATGHRVFVADNRPTLYCFDDRTGRKLWERSLGAAKEYPWRFDYYYSSPILTGNKIIIGSSDGSVYCIEQETGKVLWNVKTAGLVRGSAAIEKDMIYIGDTEGYLYALKLGDGSRQWQFRIHGSTMNLEDFGFDRKAILATPVVAAGKIIFGARDGFLYCLDRNGKQLWEADHRVSWIVSSVAVKDSFVVTGTSDGRFVQAVHLETGRELWKFRPNTLFWSSPIIVEDKVYAAGFDGMLYVLDLASGRRKGSVGTGDKVLASPVWDGHHIYLGSDDGYMYALKAHPDHMNGLSVTRHFVYQQTGAGGYFKNGADIRVSNFLVNNGYTLIMADTLSAILDPATASRTVLVLASCWLPPGISEGGKNSVLRHFLDAGGRLVLPGTNPLIFRYDAASRQPNAFSIPQADSVLDIKYGPNDTRGMGGQFPCFATEEGKIMGLPDFWNASLFLEPGQVDVILGRNENGKVSAFIKRIGKGALLQCYLHPELPQQLEALTRMAEWDLDSH